MSGAFGDGVSELVDDVAHRLEGAVSDLNLLLQTGAELLQVATVGLDDGFRFRRWRNRDSVL